VNHEKEIIEHLRRSLQLSVTLNLVLALAVFLGVVVHATVGWPDWNPDKWFKSKGAPSPYSVENQSEPDSMTLAVARKLTLWQGKNADYAPANDTGELIRYGRDLIANTAAYLGPRGSVAQISNGMNCQNCHLAAGTKPWGNNYGAVAPTYPKFRERSGAEEDIYKRVSDAWSAASTVKPCRKKAAKCKP
jgi:cytochrome c